MRYHCGSVKTRARCAAGMLFAGLFACAGTASAGLVGVKSIEVRSAIPTWLQVSEVVATQTGTGTDLATTAMGATGSALSVGFGGLVSNAIDGFGPASHPAEYHSGGTSAAEFLLITLATPSELDSITLLGRVDCCSTRDIYDLTVFDMAGGVLYSAMGLDATGPSHSVTATLSASSVPAPPTAALLIAGLAVVGFRQSQEGRRAS